SRQVYSYLEVSQARVLDGPHRLPDVRRVYEYVSRAIVRARRFNQFVVGWHPHYEVAGTGIQGIANKPTPLRPPCISDLCVHLFSDDLRERVFEAFSRLVREGEVIRIGTHAELRLRGRNRRHKHQQKYSKDHCRSWPRGGLRH